MAKPAARILLLQGLLALAGAVIVGRSVMIQVVEHSRWQARADQRKVTRLIPARRGTIYDRDGVVLANSEEQFRVSLTKRELPNVDSAMKLLPPLLNVSPKKVRHEFEGEYPYFSGPYTAEQIEPIRNLRGVHLTVVYRRVYPQDSTGVAIIGALNEEGTAGVGGLEASLDTLLRGAPGEERAWRDATGRVLASPGTVVRAPEAGHSIYLSIDRELQGIAEADLLRAIRERQAHGGDFVIYDVATGEILAAASFRLDTTVGKLRRSASALVEEYEPGSTSKLFTAAAILRSGSDTTPVSGEGGVWHMQVSRNYIRTISDVHHVTGMLGLGDAIKFSSNIAMSKFSLNLRPEEQFETLRDFGFGTGMALNFKGEASGKLIRPAEWDNPMLARPSIAQGYYFMVTTAHLAAAYAAIGNHGVLLAPTLIREVRTSGNSVVWRHQPTAIRRAIPDSVARHLLEYLQLASDTGGTGLEAQLDDYSVIGKTGTAVLNSSRKGAAREYRSSYSGLYPIDQPQIAFTVMIDRPKGDAYYGGRVAAPIVRAVLQHALALLSSPIDRKRPTMVSAPASAQLEAEAQLPVHEVVFPVRAEVRHDTGSAVIPEELSGMPVRDAVYKLQQLGFTVKLLGRGRVRSTIPAAGQSMPLGATVTVRADVSAMRLQELLRVLRAHDLLVAAPPDDPALDSLTVDSREVGPGALFIAVRGVVSDGHDYVLRALDRGAAAVVVESAVEATVPVVVVHDGRRAAQRLAEHWFGYPANTLDLVGITGTNGKTTTTALLRHLCNRHGDAGSIGTLGAFDGAGHAIASSAGSLTTPGPVDLQATLRGLLEAGVRTVVMEASSHALDQGRLDALTYQAGVFTNFTRDHLDYHGTMPAYLAAKLRLADLVAADGVLSVNADAAAWSPLLGDRRTITWGESPRAMITISEVECSAADSRFRLGGRFGASDVVLPLPGDFNVSNAVAAAAVMVGRGMSLSEVTARLESAPPVPGRMEVLSADPVHVLRDYAHTPDALERALLTLRPLTSGRLIVVVGCGGDRDKGKRPMMGALAATLADLAIVTSDNPRTEDPEQIINDIVAGISGRSFLRQVDRRLAIGAAMREAVPGDTVLLAGKGHETYQVIGTEKFPFDERRIVLEVLAQ